MYRLTLPSASLNTKYNIMDNLFVLFMQMDLPSQKVGINDTLCRLSMAFGLEENLAYSKMRNEFF